MIFSFHDPYLKVRRSFEEAELEAMMAAEAQKRTTKDTSKTNIGKSTQVDKIA